MNKDKLRDICQRLSRETGISFNVIQTHFFLESILAKIARSDEKDNFIFKGGFLLSNVIGIKQRNTVDIDVLVRNLKLTEQDIKERFKKILFGGEYSNINYEILGVEDIRRESQYGGLRVNILCKLDNIRQKIPLDIAVGDPITPREVLYKYQSIFDNHFFEIRAYNVETILAEKIQTIYSRGVFNSRSKDFYDIYILYNLKKRNINYKQLREACIRTFKYRDTNFNVENILGVLDVINLETDFKKRWDRYQEKFIYAKGISFDSILDTIDKLMNRIKFLDD